MFLSSYRNTIINQSVRVFSLSYFLKIIVITIVIFIVIIIIIVGVNVIIIVFGKVKLPVN